MKTRIVRIGDSAVVHIPKSLLDQAEVGADVELTVVGRTIVIASAADASPGWTDAFLRMTEGGDDVLLDEPLPTDFDRKTWHW